MKKVQVFFWVDTNQKARLEELSRDNRILISEYVQEAIEDLLKKHEEPKLRLVKDKEGNTGALPIVRGLKRADGIGGA